MKGSGRSSKVKVHAIAGPTREPCGTGQGFFQAQPGYIYERMAQDTGGLFLNICQEDWQPVFQQLGLDTFQAFDTFFLDQVAEPSTLQVLLDGRPVLEDPDDGYTYLFTENAIQFHGSSVPGPGQRIDLAYSTLCEP
ncbi:MAG: hypothetical protein HC923_01380 [Myxococcales bacterium]|nr:hypothetical protein [Myxococcales bacterium]